MSNHVVLIIDAAGDVVDVVDQASGNSVAYDVHTVDNARTNLDPRVSVRCMPSQLESNVQRALNAAVTSGGALQAVPLPHCSYEGRALRGCVHILPDGAEPSKSGWPLSLRYATGLTIVELERRIFNGTYLSADFFRSPEFRARADAALAELAKPRGCAPGLINSGQRALAEFRKLTSEDFPDDALLRMYRARFMEGWSPALATHDFLRVCQSSWESVHPRTAAACGHATHDTHFYLVCCYHLPPEMADQLLQLARLNPDGQSWRQLAQRKEFSRALDVSKKARESLLQRFMALTSLQPKQADGRFHHTTSDVLVANAGSDSATGVAFFSDCAPTNVEQGGVLSMTESNPDAPFYWWHGACPPRRCGSTRALSHSRQPPRPHRRPAHARHAGRHRV